MELKVKPSALSEVKLVKSPVFWLFVYMNETNVSKITSTFYHWGFIDDFLEDHMIMSSKYYISTLDMKRKL